MEDNEEIQWTRSRKYVACNLYMFIQSTRYDKNMGYNGFQLVDTFISLTKKFMMDLSSISLQRLFATEDHLHGRWNNTKET